MKKKLVFFLGGSNFSGAEKRIFLTALYISKLDLYDVVLFVRQDLFDSVKLHDKFLGYDLSSLKIVLDASFGSTRLVKRLSIPFRYMKRVVYILTHRDIIAHFALFNIIDLYLARFIKLLGGKVFFEITSPDVAVTSETKKILTNPSVCDQVICVSNNVRRICVKSSANAQARILLRHHPFVDVESQAISFENKKNQVLFAHRLIERKNPILALEAFCILAQKYQDWDFVVCGRGELESVVKSKILSTGLPNIIFMGYEVNIKALLNESKIFISLIEPDNYPSQSVIEGLAVGCAILLSQTGQSEEKFLSKGKLNGLAANLDIDSVTKTLESMILSDGLSEMCQNSVQHFDVSFSLDAYLSESIAFYKDV